MMLRQVAGDVQGREGRGQGRSKRGRMTGEGGKGHRMVGKVEGC